MSESIPSTPPGPSDVPLAPTILPSTISGSHQHESTLLGQLLASSHDPPRLLCFQTLYLPLAPWGRKTSPRLLCDLPSWDLVSLFVNGGNCQDSSRLLPHLTRYGEPTSDIPLGQEVHGGGGGGVFVSYSYTLLNVLLVLPQTCC